jgi:hypothetical protein
VHGVVSRPNRHHSAWLRDDADTPVGGRPIPEFPDIRALSPNAGAVAVACSVDSRTLWPTLQNVAVGSLPSV